MKIIGKTSENGLLLSATEDEVANLIGYYGKYSEDAQSHLKPGTDIHISEIFKTLYYMSTRKRELEEAAAKLRCCADAITLTCPVVEAVAAMANAGGAK